jgi:hypothetical protein
MASVVTPEPKLEIRRQPWREWPYPLVSWWDMQKFSASGFIEAMNLLEGLPLLCDAADPRSLVDPRSVDSSQIVLESLRSECANIGLDFSVTCINELIDELPMRAGLTVRYFRERCAEVANTIRREMQVCLFFRVDYLNAKFYDQMELLGPEVTKRFPPSVLDDAREAGNCLALGRSTACVFHLMRVMETGVQEFGRALGVTLVDEKCWQNILDEVNKAIKSLPTKDPNTAELSEAAAALYSVKVAWRNQVMHPKDKYDEKEAADILQHVKTFMGQLARII